MVRLVNIARSASPASLAIPQAGSSAASPPASPRRSESRPGDRFEAGTDGLVLAVLSLEAGRRVDVEEEREGRGEATGSKAIDIAEGREVETASVALVGERGRLEAVTDDDGAALESRPDRRCCRTALPVCRGGGRQ